MTYIHGHFSLVIILPSEHIFWSHYFANFFFVSLPPFTPPPLLCPPSSSWRVGGMHPFEEKEGPSICPQNAPYLVYYRNRASRHRTRILCYVFFCFMGQAWRDAFIYRGEIWRIRPVVIDGEKKRCEKPIGVWIEKYWPFLCGVLQPLGSGWS